MLNLNPVGLKHFFFVFRFQIQILTFKFSSRGENKTVIMAFPWPTVIGPGVQQFIIQGQIPLIQQPIPTQMVAQVPVSVQAQHVIQQQPHQAPQVQQQKLPDYMSEDKLQEKGK
jgi:hypothetical protein